MKYVILKNSKTGKIRKLGRFSGEPDYFDEYYSPISNSWKEDNILYSELLDGLLEEISETEAKQIIATEFSQEKQAA